MSERISKCRYVLGSGGAIDAPGGYQLMNMREAADELTGRLHQTLFELEETLRLRKEIEELEKEIARLKHGTKTT